MLKNLLRVYHKVEIASMSKSFRLKMYILKCYLKWSFVKYHQKISCTMDKIYRWSHRIWFVVFLQGRLWVTFSTSDCNFSVRVENDMYDPEVNDWNSFVFPLPYPVFVMSKHHWLSSDIWCKESKICELDMFGVPYQLSYLENDSMWV